MPAMNGAMGEVCQRTIPVSWTDGTLTLWEQMAVSWTGSFVIFVEFRGQEFRSFVDRSFVDRRDAHFGSFVDRRDAHFVGTDGC